LVGQQKIYSFLGVGLFVIFLSNGNKITNIFGLLTSRKYKLNVLQKHPL